MLGFVRNAKATGLGVGGRFFREAAVVPAGWEAAMPGLRFEGGVGKVNGFLTKQRV